MYNLLLLVSLAAVVSCMGPVPDPFGDDSRGQERIKRLDKLDDSVDRLIARAQNLKDRLARTLKNREEADRKAKNILLRLDRMDLDDGVQRCSDPDKEFRCRKGSKCIRNILVCDGHNDCGDDDNSDEDKDLCTFPAKPGETWEGPQIWWRCTPEDAKENTNVSFIFHDFKTDPRRKSVNRLESSIFWMDDYKDESMYQRSGSTNGRYNYAKQRAETSFGHDGMEVLLTMSFSELSRDIFMMDSYRHDGTHCHHGIMFKKTW